MNHFITNVRQCYWSEAFRAGKQCGVMRDGHYHIPTDRDFVLMYCMGGEL